MYCTCIRQSLPDAISDLRYNKQLCGNVYRHAALLLTQTELFSVFGFLENRKNKGGRLELLTNIVGLARYEIKVLCRIKKAAAKVHLPTWS